MKIVFCTTCKNRTQHLKITLPRNLTENTDCADAKFVVLDYHSDDDLQEYLWGEHAAEILAGRVVNYKLLGDSTPFKMAHAKNVAHRCGLLEGADVLVNLDADNFAGEGFARHLQEEFAEHDSRIFLAMGKMLKGIMPRGLSGRIAVGAQAFVNVGGYDEQFQTWSPDDKDFNFRLRRMGYQYREIDRRFLDCIRHNDRMRFREYRQATTKIDSNADDWDWVRNRSETVVNFGHFGEGRAVRNPPLPAQLRQVPTRIFGIGLHKTGTTSLHWALRTLGIDCAHWPSAHWAKTVWEEATANDGRSLTLERHYAACDLPLPLLYRALDRAYPNSKFILTTRDAGDWLASVERHWSRDYNPFRAQWDADPFTHRVHRLLYGQKSFHAETMLSRYLAHNVEVRDYFAGRKGDLLVLDRPDWGPLCAFLNRPVPRTPYPITNKSEEL